MGGETQANGLQELSAGLARLVERVSPSVVMVHDGRRSVASGFHWREGLVVTAYDALGDAKSVTIGIDGKEHKATLTGRDPSTDIAVLKVEGLSAPVLPLTAEASPKAGEVVLAVARREQGVAARFGIVSLTGGAWRSMRGGQIDSLLRLDLTLDRRSEGGPVIDSQGRVLGMAVRGPRRSVLAIPAATIERIGARILDKGSVRPGYLGLGLHPVRVRGQGGEHSTALMVLGVAPGGPGQAAGVLQGDVVTAWNGEAVTGLRGVFRRLGPDSVGQTVELSLLRAGQSASARCVIGARPEA